MSLWYNANFHFAAETENASGIVKKAAKRHGIPVNENGAKVKEERMQSNGLKFVEFVLQDPGYEQMHEFTKEVLEKSNGLCTSVHVSTWYVRGEP